MDIKILNEFVRFDEELDLFDLAQPYMIIRNDVPLSQIEIEEWHEMRPDLIFRDMYDIIDVNQIGVYLGNIDIILFLNDIDNPLNIKKGMTLVYPTSFDDFDKFRFTEDTDSDVLSVKERLVVPNKTTKKDKNREKFKENGFLLPPTVLDKPRSPVRIENGQFSIGGL
jgi:hypothetical protein